MRARLGPKQAIVATAHKIARTVYHLLKTGEPYREESDVEYERKRQERELKHLERRAQKLGYTLAPVPTTAPELLAEAGGEGDGSRAGQSLLQSVGICRGTCSRSSCTFRLASRGNG